MNLTISGPRKVQGIIEKVCLMCKKIFRHPRTIRTKKYCSKKCAYQAGKTTKNIGKAKYKKPSPFEQKWRPCLGVGCRGEKLFLSTNRANRICKDCKQRSKGHEPEEPSGMSIKKKTRQV